MVWYIRFLKTPKIDQRSHVRALITIATDLGDGFYPSDLTLHATITTTDDEEKRISEWQTVMWKSGMRALWIDNVNVDTDTLAHFRLVVNSTENIQGNSISMKDVPEILGIWSDVFDRNKCQAGSMIERRYKTASDPRKTITEETGESIARHIWDAGIALIAFLTTIVSQPRSTTSLSELLRKSSFQGPSILELGSGCGITGLHVASLCPGSKVLLTDLPNAMDVLNYNVKIAEPVSNGSKLATAVLDWDDSLPKTIAEERFDLVILSDCTYNSDSIPGLVKTLSSIMKTSPDALIVISLKARHESEAILFDLMADAGIIEVEHTAIPLPDRCRSEIGQELEVVEIIVYRCRKTVEIG